MSYTPNNAWDRSPQTGLASNPGPFMAEVMRNNDPLYSGRLLVYIPDFGGDPKQESSWHLVRYMTPYYGIQPISNRLEAEPSDKTESYGMWMTPPDLGVKVLVMFINGDRSKGVWIGCLPEIGSHGSIPGNDKGDFDVFANQSAANRDIKSIPRPEHSTAPTFTPQGLDEDAQRGKPITTSSLRETPTRAFGMNTPSGHSFFMDDGDEQGTNKMYRMRTAAGNMIMMNDDNGFVYVINAKGTAWIELSPNGFVDIYGELGISMATPGNIDMHASGNINMHAGQNVRIVAEKEAKFQGTEKAKVYGGRLLMQGSESLEMYSCGLLKLTGSRGMHFKSSGAFMLEGRVFKWNSGSAAEAEQVAPDTPTEITGYTSTVLRAPNHEPWPGHDESYEETPQSPTDESAFVSANVDSAFDSITYDAFGDVIKNDIANVPGVSDIASTVSNVADDLRVRISTSNIVGSNIDQAISQVNQSLQSADLSFVNLANQNQILPNELLNNALSIRSNIADAENLIGQLASPLTSRNGLLEKIAIDGLSELIETTEQLQDLQNLVGTIGNVGGIIQDLSNLNIGNLGNVGEVLTKLPIGIPVGITNIIPPDVGNIVSEATQALGSMGAAQASTIIPSGIGGGAGGFAPASAVGSDCAICQTRGFDTPAAKNDAAQGNAGNAHPGAPGNVVPPSELANDPEWQAELAKLKARFPELDEGDLYKVIQGESKFNSTVVNPTSGATGLFQFIPSTARGLGTSTAEIQRMTPAQQLNVYGKYLGQFNYGGGPLGIMQAAPGTYSNLIRKYGSWSKVPSNIQMYRVGSAAWRQNPGWRGPDGRITIGSVNRYYGKQSS